MRMLGPIYQNCFETKADCFTKQKNMIDSLVKTDSSKSFLDSLQMFDADMHEKKDAGQLNGHSSAEVI